MSDNYKIPIKETVILVNFKRLRVCKLVDRIRSKSKILLGLLKYTISDSSLLGVLLQDPISLGVQTLFIGIKEEFAGEALDEPDHLVTIEFFREILEEIPKCQPLL
jgi:hypothetical protein